MNKFGYPYSLDQIDVLGLMIANERAAINFFCRVVSIPAILQSSASQITISANTGLLTSNKSSN